MRRIVACRGVRPVGLACCPDPTQAQSVALSGQVTSAKEGAMEGVVVSAKKVGSTVTVSVRDRRQGPLQLPGEPA